MACRAMTLKASSVRSKPSAAATLLSRPTMASKSMRRKSNRWHRDTTVDKSSSGSVVAKTNLV